MEKKQRVELRLHTNMSTNDGINTVSEYIDEGLKNLMPAIAITDHANVHSFPEAYKTIKRCGGGIKLIYGVDAFLIDDSEKMLSFKNTNQISKNTETDDTPEKYYHASILAKNRLGLKNLYKLVSLANTEYFHQVPRTPKSEFLKYREGLLISSGDDDGELYHAVREGKSFSELVEIAKFYDYLEIVPIDNLKYYIDYGYAKDESDLININKKIIELGEKIGKIVVVVSDAHYIYTDDGLCRKIIKHSIGSKNYNNQSNLRMRSTQEMLDEFRWLDRNKAYKIVVENTNKIADMIDDTFPPYDEDFNHPYNEYYDYPSEIEKLKNIAFCEAHKKFGDNLHERIIDRIEFEFDIIEKNNRSIMRYLICKELVEKSKQKGYMVGNRGSVGSSLVAYLIGITNINPLQAHYYCKNCNYIEFYDEQNCGVDLTAKDCPKCGEKLLKDGFGIPPETFMGFDGTKEVLFELSVSPEYFKEAKKNIDKMFNGNTIYCGTVENLSYRIASDIVDDYCRKENKKYSNEFEVSLWDRIANAKRETDRFPESIFIIPKGKDICDYTPIQYCANNIDCGEKATHFDYHYLQDILLKIDLFAYKRFSILYRLEKLTGISPDDIPLDDIETMTLIKNGDTIGIAAFSSEHVRNIIEKIKPCRFDDLIKISGFSIGTDVWDDNAEELLDNGMETCNLISTRDDVTIMLGRWGVDRKYAYKISESVRKGMSITETQYNDLVNMGVPKWFLDSCIKIRYSFPRAHIADYVQISFKEAYFKAHYPLEFYCAILENYIDQFEKEMLNEGYILYSDDQWYRDMDKECVAEICKEIQEKGYEIILEQNENKNIIGFKVENGKIFAVYNEKHV